MCHKRRVILMTITHQLDSKSTWKIVCFKHNSSLTRVVHGLIAIQWISVNKTDHAIR